MELEWVGKEEEQGRVVGCAERRGPSTAPIWDLLPRQPRYFIHVENAEHCRRLHAC